MSVAALRPVAPVPPAHRGSPVDPRVRRLIRDLIAGLRGSRLQLA